MVHAEQIGSGSGHLILLHGWGQNGRHLRGFAQLLAPYYQVHLLDLPGFGKSPNPKKVWSSFDYADCIHNYLQKQQIETCVVLGHSFGGKVALSLAMHYPNQVARLILVASSGLKPHYQWKQRCRLFLIRQSGRWCKRVDRLLRTTLFTNWFVPRFGSQDYRQAGVLRPTLVKSINEPLSDWDKVQAPTLLLWGECDRDTPVESGRRMAGAIANAHLITFPNKGHQLLQGVSGHLVAYQCLAYLRARE